MDQLDQGVGISGFQQNHLEKQYPVDELLEQDLQGLRLNVVALQQRVVLEK